MLRVCRRTCTEGYNGRSDDEVAWLEEEVDEEALDCGVLPFLPLPDDTEDSEDESVGFCCEGLDSALSSAGLSRVERSSPDSANTAMRVPTLIAEDPSGC